MQLSTAYKQRLAKAARIATAGAMVVSSVGTAMTPVAFASGQLTTNKTEIGDSRPSNPNTKYVLKFTTPASSTTAIAQVTVKFCNAAGDFAGCVGPTGMDINAGMAGASAAGFGGSGAASPGTFSRTSANAFTFLPTTPAAETNIEHSIDLTGLITNPSNQGSYYTMVRTYSDAGTTTIDDGTSAFAIVNKVDVSGRVVESLTFTVNGVNTGITCGGENAAVTSTAVSIPFGNFVSGTPRVACQTVATATNAVGGYTTTIREVLGGATAVEGAMCRQTASLCVAEGGQAGVSATNVIANAGGLDSTVGAWVNGTDFGLGVNANGGQPDTQYGGNTGFRSLNGSTPIAVATFNGPTNATATTVKFKADVPATQTAGLYQNSLEYVTTPIF